MTTSPIGPRGERLKAHEKMIRQVIEREFSASRMSNTKWREVADALSGLGLGDHRIKFVDGPEARELSHFRSATDRWFDSSPWGPFLTLEVEWLDLNPVQEIRRGALVGPQRVDHAQELERRLRSAGVPYEWAGAYLRITGHVRK